MQEAGETEYLAILNASDEVIAEQCRRTAVPRRFSAVTRQIWLLQARLRKTRGKRWKRLLYEQRFRAAYDFLLLRRILRFRNCANSGPRRRRAWILHPGATPAATAAVTAPGGVTGDVRTRPVNTSYREGMAR